MEKMLLLKSVLSLFIVSVCILPIYNLSALIFTNLPDVKYPVYIIDLYGFVPTLLVVINALCLYIQGKNKRHVGFKMALFAFSTATFTLLFIGYVNIGHGLNFDLPMIFLILFFTCLYEMLCMRIVPEEWKPWLTLIQNENNMKEILAAIIALVGLPLLLLDTLPALIFQIGVVGGAGIRDGLNKMLMILTLYAILLYGTNRLLNQIIK